MSSEYYTLGYVFMRDELAAAKARIWEEIEDKYGDQPEYSEIETGASDAEWD